MYVYTCIYTCLLSRNDKVKLFRYLFGPYRREKEEVQVLLCVYTLS